MARDLDALVSQLDLDEKAALLAGADMWSTVAVERVGIPSVRVTDGPNGARGPALPAGMEAAPQMTSLCLPSGSALGATWDPELIQRVGGAIGAEARLKACRVLLAPTVNLHRSPLGGRNFESYSEDPLLAGRLGAAFVRGAQSEGVACTVKHFAGNESEDDRMVADSIIDERTLRELHLLPFELAVTEGGALGIMTSYNRLNGEYCADSEALLAGILRDEWGFDGFVISDWFAFADTAAAARAGLDLEMPGPGRAFGPALAAAVRAGEAEEDLVDAAVVRLLSVLDRVGALDDDPGQEPRSERIPAHSAVARDAATAAMVLLRNDGVLPLDPESFHRIAVIGPNADRAVIMGGGSASLPVPELRTPLDALRDRLPSDVTVVHEPGVDITLTTPEIPGAWLRSAGEPGLLVECHPLGDQHHPVHTERSNSGTVMWFGPPPAAGPTFAWRATGELTVDRPGRWTLSLAQTEDARVLIDDEVVIDGHDRELPPGHDFFGAARREQTVEIDLTPDRPVRIEVQSQVTKPGLLLGAKLGLRPALPPDAFERAVDAARSADTVVVVVGTDGDWETEGHDRQSIDLPGRQAELVDAVLAAAPEAVVVLNTGSTIAVPFAPRCRALLQCWFGGSELAEALTDVLLGDADPGGRLPTTIPNRLEDNPTWGNSQAEDGRTVYGERLLVGYRWYESRRLDVAFPFGHGLSYSHFEIGPPELSSSRFTPGGTVIVRVPVANIGDRRGQEVVQLYVSASHPRVFRPVKELKAFAKVTLDPGATSLVELELSDRAFARWSAKDSTLAGLLERQVAQAPFMPRPEPVGERGWVIDAGRYDIHVGRSTTDIAHVVSLDVELAAVR